MLHDFKKRIGSVVFQSIDSRCRIKKGDAPLLQKRNDFTHFETFMFQIHKMIVVTKPYLSLDAPMVIGEIGIKEIHAPPLLGRRKTAKKQHFGIGRKERF